MAAGTAERKEQSVKELIIDDEFDALCPPLTFEEQNNLEASIEANGCRDALICWKSGDKEILVDGHNRYRICRTLGKEFKTTFMPFDCRTDVVDFIVRNQLSRRNLTEEQKAYLRGKRLEAEKKSVGRPNDKYGQPAHILTQDRIAEELGVSGTTIRRNQRFAKAVDSLASAGGKAVKEQILSGRVGMSLTESDVAAVESLQPKQLKQVAEAVAEGKVKTVKQALDLFEVSRPASKKPPTANETMAARLRNKPSNCLSILCTLDEIGEALTAARQRIEETGGEFASHKFDMDENSRRLNMARKLISQVRSAIKGA